MVTTTDQEPGPKRLFLGGIFFGFAALTTPVVLVTVVAMTLWMWYWRHTHRFLLTTLFLLGVALLLVPWTVRNFFVYDRLVIVEPRVIQELSWIGNLSKDGQDNKQGSTIKAILEYSGRAAMRFFWNFRYFWELYPHRVAMNSPTYREKEYEQDARIVRETVFGTEWTNLISVCSVGPMFLFALVGAGAMWFQKEQRGHLSLLGLMILSFAFAYSFGYGKIRYRLPVEPYILILSAYGIWHMWTIVVQGKGFRKDLYSG
jgi:hypothetical protein